MSLMTHLHRGLFSFWGHAVISVWSRLQRACCRPLGANKKRRRCTLPLDSESPLVHSTQITKLAGPELDLDSRAEEADLICLLTDGSPDHTQQPACQPCWNGVAAHGEVGEGTQAEEEMIVIEYEMSITWNEHTVEVGRGLVDWLSYLGHKQRFFLRDSCSCLSLFNKLLSWMALIQTMYCLMPWFILLSQ